MNFKLNEAIAFACEKHDGVNDKGGFSYILHPLRVMMAQDIRDPEIMMAAVLHDVHEDCDVSLDEIEDRFGKRVRDLVDAVSRRKPQGETYAQFIERCSKNADAIKIKLEDLKDNTDLRRLAQLPDDTIGVAERYVKAYRKLTGRYNDHARSDC